MTTRQRTFWLAALAILLLAAGLRFYQLDAQSLWNDEGTAAALALRDLGTIARNAADDIHPPLYYWLLAIWVRAWGNSEFALRSLSALMGVATVAFTMQLARRWFTERTALLSGLLAAISPLAVYYSQEARMYMQVTLLGVAAMLALSHVLPADEEREPFGLWPMVAYGLSTLAMLYSHYYAVTLLLAQNIAFVIWLALRRRRDALWRELGIWAAVQLVLGALYAVWLAMAWHTIRHWPSISAPLTLGQLMLRLGQALPLGITMHTSASTLTIGLLLAVLAAVGLARRAQMLGPGRLSWWPVIATGLYAAVPVLVMYAASLRRPMYNPKFLLLATPGYLLLLARGIENIADALIRQGQRRLGALVLVLLVLGTLAPMVVSLHGLYRDEAFARDDYRSIVAYIEAAAGPNDAIIINAPSQIETVDYYYQGAWPLYPLPRDRPAHRAETEAELAELLARHEQIYAICWATDESDPDKIVEGYLDRHAFKTVDAWYGHVRLVVYTTARQVPQQPGVATTYRLGEYIRLDGFSLLTPEPISGDAVQVSLFWRTEQPIRERYKVFVHLVDANGHIVGQHDAEPAGGSQPTDSWGIDEVIRDNHGVLVQPGTPPGPLTLRLGLYSATTGERLPVTADGVSVGDAIDLAKLSLSLPAVPLPIEAFDVENRTSESVASVDLLGYSLYPLGKRHEQRRALYPGETVELLLYARSAGRASGTLQVRLERFNSSAAGLVLGDVTGGLPEGHIARTVGQFAIAADAAPGRYRLMIRTADGQQAQLGMVSIVAP